MVCGAEEDHYRIIMQNSFKKRSEIPKIILSLVVLSATLTDIFSDAFFGKFQELHPKSKVAVVFFAIFAFFSLCVDFGNV